MLSNIGETRISCDAFQYGQSSNYRCSRCPGVTWYFLGRGKKYEEGASQIKSPNENLAPGNLRISRVFFKFHGGFKMSKKRSNYESSVFLRICGGEKKDLFWFLAIFDKNTGHRVTKFYPDTRISNTYKSYFINFFLTRKKLFFVSLIYAIESSFDI